VGGKADSQAEELATGNAILLHMGTPLQADWNHSVANEGTLALTVTWAILFLNS
jgi:hypothetical protein